MYIKYSHHKSLGDYQRIGSPQDARALQTGGQVFIARMYAQSGFILVGTTGLIAALTNMEGPGAVVGT